MNKPQDKPSESTLRSPAGLGLLDKWLRGQQPNAEEMAAAKRIAQAAVAQQDKAPAPSKAMGLPPPR